MRPCRGFDSGSNPDSGVLTDYLVIFMPNGNKSDKIYDNKDGNITKVSYIDGNKSDNK